MNKNTIYLFIIGLLVFAACDPIEDRQSMEPAKSETELLASVSVEVDGNKVVCTTSEKGLIAQWVSSSGWMATGPAHEFVVALAGDYDIDISFYGGDKVVKVTQSFNITQDDPNFFDHPYWQLLAKTEDGAIEKTWVWADDNTYQPDCIWGKGGWLSPTPNWWAPSIADAIDSKGMALTDKLTFKMDGLSFDSETGATPGSGSGTWVLQVGGEHQVLDEEGNVVFEGKLVLTGHSIPFGVDGDAEANVYYEYYIVNLTENELRLCATPTANDGDAAAWFWHFKKEGYSY